MFGSGTWFSGNASSSCRSRIRETLSGTFWGGGGRMNCLPENILRTYHDGELSPAQGAEIETHLGTCVSCSERAREIIATSEQVHGQLEFLRSAESETNIDAHAALSRFKAQHLIATESVPSA